MSGARFTRSANAHRRAFFRSWLEDPFNVASVVPSGVMLARQMSEGLHEGAVVVELGAGTGTVTRAILDCGVTPRDLYLVERNVTFASILEQRFPRCAVLEGEADTVAEHWPHLIGKVDFVVSGLPIVWFDRRKKMRILDAAFRLLAPRGCLHQFTYLGLPPVGRALRDNLRLAVELLSCAPLNFPPAFVYRFTQQAPASGLRAPHL